MFGWHNRKTPFLMHIHANFGSGGNMEKNLNSGMKFLEISPFYKLVYNSFFPFIVLMTKKKRLAFSLQCQQYSFPCGTMNRMSMSWAVVWLLKQQTVKLLWTQSFFFEFDIYSYFLSSRQRTVCLPSHSGLPLQSNQLSADLPLSFGWR